VQVRRRFHAATSSDPQRSMHPCRLPLVLLIEHVFAGQGRCRAEKSASGRKKSASDQRLPILAGTRAPLRAAFIG
jgi:hypothetical protein